MREDLRRARRFARRLEPWDPEAPIPPPLPPGAVVAVPERGEVFYRHHQGPPGSIAVLLLHGWTASADVNWFLAYRMLAEHHTVVALDHRGHGRGIRDERPFTLEDAADDAAALLDVLGIEGAVAVGYSMGGPIAMLLAHRHPDLVQGLVLEGTALEWRAGWYERIVWRFMSLLEAGLRAGTGQGMVRRILRQAMEDEPSIAPYRSWLRGELRRGDPADIAEAGRALGRYDARPFAASLGMPAAVVVTTRDRLVRPKKQRALAKALGARVFELDGDHDAPLVKGGQFADVTREATAWVASRALV